MTRAAIVLAVAALAAPGAARAELVAQGVSSAALAVAPDGSPRAAYVAGTRLVLATRTASGWTSARVTTLPGRGGSVVGLAVSPAGGVEALVEAANGRWLVLYERRGATARRTSLVPRLPAGAAIGRAGLALDRRGFAVVAYAEWRPSHKTFLRVVRLVGGRYRTAGVTRQGFPPSDVPPAAAPVVLRNGTVRVVEAYGARGSAAIDWYPLRRDWEGQFLYTSPLASLAGGVLAGATAAGVYAAWTLGFPTLGKLAVVVAHHGSPVTSSLVFEDAILAGLALGPEGPTIAATAFVDGLPAALVQRPNADGIELDGAAAALARDQVLLVRDGALEWFALPPAHRTVTLAAAPTPGGVALSGTVGGPGDGSVILYRERPGESRVAIASLPLAADGSFGPFVDAPGAPAYYRAVYSDGAGGAPYASLLRTQAAPG